MYYFFRAFINTVFDHIGEGIYFTDSDRNILYWNSGAEMITGYRFDEVARQNCYQIIDHIDQNGQKLFDIHCPITQPAENYTPPESLLSIVHKDGHLVPVVIRIFPVFNDDAEITGFINLVTDNSRQKLEQAKMSALTKAAYIDSLSELFSKQYLENRLQALLTETPDKRKTFSILYINITDFREINETYGVSRADKLIKLVAKALSTAISPPNIIGRWHGASFIAIMEITNKSLLLLLADKLKALVAETEFSVGEETVSIHLAVGYTISQNYDTISYIIERAVKASASLEEKPPEAPAVEPPVSKVAPAVSKPSKHRFHSVRSSR